MNGQPLSVESFAEWREAARELLAQDIAPHDVQWRSAREDRDLFAMHAEPAVETPSSKAAAPALRLPRILMDMLQAAACFRAPDRWAFLYRVVWRWMHGEKDVISPADIDGARLTSMVKSVPTCAFASGRKLPGRRALSAGSSRPTMCCRRSRSISPHAWVASAG
jgi:hypothetical protein